MSVTTDDLRPVTTDDIRQPAQTRTPDQTFPTAGLDRRLPGQIAEMTTTHTFQGLTSDGKPSSRVLNPPGGSSSNIFGANDEPQQRVPIRNNPDNVNRGNSDVFGPGHNAAVSQQKSRAPRSGDDSFHTLFGSCENSGGKDKAINVSRRSSPVKGCDNQRVEHPQRSVSRIHQKSPDTFLSIFGREGVERRKMFRSVLNSNDDSFGRLFGQSSINELTQSSPALSVRSSGISTLSSSHSKFSNTVSRMDSTEDDVISSRFSPVSGTSVARDKRRARQGRFSDRGGYNPITGESYEQAKTKQEAPAHINNAASKTDVVSAHISEPSETCSSVTVVEEDKLQPEIEDRGQAPAPTPVAADQKKQTGVFAGSEDPKELRSTRVSQPPGGRSTKLW